LANSSRYLNNEISVRMAEELREKGWCFVRLSDDLCTKELSENLEKFFAKDAQDKNRYSAEHGFGYSEVDHKEGLKVLTGWRFKKNFVNKGVVPEEIADILKKIIYTLDSKVLSICYSMCKNLFDIKPSTLAVKADLPVGFGDTFGMLDFAHYRNKKTTSIPIPPIGNSVEDVNCVPHVDPGVLSLSFFSTNEGLQLLDPRTNQWISGPINTIEEQENLGVIWLGEAAVKVSNKPINAGIHRVIYPNIATPRITGWYEMCTIKQTEPPEDVVLIGDVQVPNIMGDVSIKAEKGDKKVDVLSKIERRFGVPPRKISRLDDQFNAINEPNMREKHERKNVSENGQ